MSPLLCDETFNLTRWLPIRCKALIWGVNLYLILLWWNRLRWGMFLFPALFVDFSLLTGPVWEGGRLCLDAFFVLCLLHFSMLANISEPLKYTVIFVKQAWHAYWCIKITHCTQKSLILLNTQEIEILVECCYCCYNMSPGMHDGNGPCHCNHVLYSFAVILLSIS